MAPMEVPEHRSHGQKSVVSILICAAIQMEAEAIAKALHLTWDKPRLRATASNVVLHVVGICACRLPADLKKDEVGLVISAGLAGALDPSLSAGDVVIDRADCVAVEGARCGRIHCADSIVATPGQKAQLFQQTKALAVDMESSAIARFAKAHDAAFVAIRAISDTANQAVDPAVLRLVDPFGHAKTGAVISTLIRRPTLVPHLMRLRSRSIHACERLAEAVAAYVRSRQSVDR